MKSGKRLPRFVVGVSASALLVMVCAGAASAAPLTKRTPHLAKATAAARAAATPLERAHALMQKGDRAGALKAFESAVAAEPQNARLWAVVGDLRYSLDRVDTAVDAWAQAMSLAPWNDGVAERVARGSVKLGDFARAAAAEQHVVDLLKAQIDEGSRDRRTDLGTGRSQSVADAYVQHLGILSELYVLAGDFTPAEQAARTLIRFAPASVEGRLALAYVHLHAAEYDDAADLYEEILRVQPGQATALNNLGNIQYMRRDFNAAAELFERILETENVSKYSESIALANLGELLQLQSAFKDAGQMYEQAIEVMPEGAWGYMGKAALLDVQGKHDDAVDVMIDGWERDRNRLTRLNMHFYMEEWAWQRDALIAEIEGDGVLAAKLWRRILDGDVEMLKKSAAWHLRSLELATR